jgi:hypothetical protein
LKAAFISGVAIQPLRELFEYQLEHNETPEAREEFWREVNGCNAQSQWLFHGDLSCAWFKVAFARPSMRAELESLWDLPGADKFRFQIFQNIDDVLTPWEPVRAFDQANGERQAQEKSHLDWYARYYTGGHNQRRNPAFGFDRENAIRDAFDAK